MYASIKKWLTVPFQRVPCISITATGDKTFGPAEDNMCYSEKKITMVVNREGQEVLSDTRLYVEGSLIIGENDEVIFESATRPVKAVASFFEGNTGLKDIQVVYL